MAVYELEAVSSESLSIDKDFNFRVHHKQRIMLPNILVGLFRATESHRTEIGAGLSD
jgi:hypothetical protein